MAPLWRVTVSEKREVEFVAKRAAAASRPGLPRRLIEAKAGRDFLRRL